MLIAALDTDRTTFLFTAPESGEYELIVAAVDAFGIAQALSEPISVRANDGTGSWTLNLQIYLPFVQK